MSSAKIDTSSSSSSAKKPANKKETGPASSPKRKRPTDEVADEEPGAKKGKSEQVPVTNVDAVYGPRDNRGIRNRDEDGALIPGELPENVTPELLDSLLSMSPDVAQIIRDSTGKMRNMDASVMSNEKTNKPYFSVGFAQSGKDKMQPVKLTLLGVVKHSSLAGAASNHAVGFNPNIEHKGGYEQPKFKDAKAGLTVNSSPDALPTHLASFNAAHPGVAQKMEKNRHAIARITMAQHVRVLMAVCALMLEKKKSKEIIARIEPHVKVITDMQRTFGDKFPKLKFDGTCFEHALFCVLNSSSITKYRSFAADKNLSPEERAAEAAAEAAEAAEFAGGLTGEEAEAAAAAAAVHKGDNAAGESEDDLFDSMFDPKTLRIMNADIDGNTNDNGAKAFGYKGYHNISQHLFLSGSDKRGSKIDESWFEEASPPFPAEMNGMAVWHPSVRRNGARVDMPHELDFSLPMEEGTTVQTESIVDWLTRSNVQAGDLVEVSGLEYGVNNGSFGVVSTFSPGYKGMHVKILARYNEDTDVHTPIDDSVEGDTLLLPAAAPAAPTITAGKKDLDAVMAVAEEAK